MSISYPYSSKQIEEGIIPDPIATFGVETTIGEQNFDFLVDSGADTTTLPLLWAPLFGFKPKIAEKTWIGGIEGGKVAAYPSIIKIRRLFLEI